MKITAEAHVPSTSSLDIFPVTYYFFVQRLSQRRVLYPAATPGGADLHAIFDVLAPAAQSSRGVQQQA